MKKYVFVLIAFLLLFVIVPTSVSANESHSSMMATSDMYNSSQETQIPVINEYGVMVAIIVATVLIASIVFAKQTKFIYDHAVGKVEIQSNNNNLTNENVEKTSPNTQQDKNDDEPNYKESSKDNTKIAVFQYCTVVFIFVAFCSLLMYLASCIF